MNGLPNFFEPFFLTLSEGNKWWPVRIGLLLLLVYMIYRKDLRVPALLCLPAAGLANETCDILKATFQMLRPSVELAVLNLRVERLTSFGTASSHAANMMAIACLFLFYKRIWGYWWLGIAVFTGISRIYVGVHYPYQVLYGWFVGAAVSGILIFIEQKLRRRKENHQENMEDSPGDNERSVI